MLLTSACCGAAELPRGRSDPQNAAPTRPHAGAAPRRGAGSIHLRPGEGRAHPRWRVPHRGLDASAAGVVLDSEDFAQDVARDQAQAAQLGANGVPFFVIDMKYGISGAQPQEVFNQTLEAARAEQ